VAVTGREIDKHLGVGVSSDEAVTEHSGRAFQSTVAFAEGTVDFAEDDDESNGTGVRRCRVSKLSARGSRADEVVS
jgi:hypothetical protein